MSQSTIPHIRSQILPYCLITLTSYGWTCTATSLHGWFLISKINLFPAVPVKTAGWTGPVGGSRCKPGAASSQSSRRSGFRYRSGSFYRIRFYKPVVVLRTESRIKQISASKKLGFLTQKIVSNLSDRWPGMLILDPDWIFLPIPDQGVKKGPDPKYFDPDILSCKSQ